MTERRSPRTPLPLSLKTAAMRPTYCGLGLLVIRCWMSCLQTNGPTLGCWKIFSSAAVRISCGGAACWQDHAIEQLFRTCVVVVIEGNHRSAIVSGLAETRRAPGFVG